jgi:hypothetical protein
VGLGSKEEDTAVGVSMVDLDKQEENMVAKRGEDIMDGKIIVIQEQVLRKVEMKSVLIVKQRVTGQEIVLSQEKNKEMRVLAIKDRDSND